VLVVVRDDRQGRVGVGLGCTGSGYLVGVGVFCDGVVMPYVTFNFKNFPEWVASGKEGVCENGGGKLEVIKSGGYALECDELGFYNAVKCMWGVEGCVM